MLAALHLAAEDDALESKSTVPLPVAAFSKRLDSLVNQLRGALATSAIDTSSPDAAAQFCRSFLFNSMEYKVRTISTSILAEISLR